MTGRAAAAVMAAVGIAAGGAEARERWTEQEAAAWYARMPWLVGCNYNPASAINELEMWQAETFDPASIDRELGWAESLGFTSLRVYLHNIPWQQDAKGFLDRMDRFLAIADRHRIGVMFVLLDSCWDPHPKPGPQRAPRPHVHNSGWVQCPGAEILSDPARHGELRGYIHGVVARFKDDRRVHAWDVFNEPENDNRNSYGAAGAKTEIPNKAEMALALLPKAFAWAREANPSQPLSAAPWRGPWPEHAAMDPIERAMIEESDVISFHNYADLGQVKLRVGQLRRYNRPILCSEYMARPAGSTFDPVLGWLKEQKVGGYNWGFVAGKTQTQYPWDSWQKAYTAEPPVWFHEILRDDGSPYRPEEVRYIRSLTGRR